MQFLGNKCREYRYMWYSLSPKDTSLIRSEFFGRRDVLIRGRPLYWGLKLQVVLKWRSWKCKSSVFVSRQLKMSPHLSAPWCPRLLSPSGSWTSTTRHRSSINPATMLPFWRTPRPGFQSAWFLKTPPWQYGIWMRYTVWLQLITPESVLWVDGIGDRRELGTGKCPLLFSNIPNYIACHIPDMWYARYYKSCNWRNNVVQATVVRQSAL